MITPMKITEEMKKRSFSEVDCIVRRINADIYDAVKKNRSSCYFRIDKLDEHYQEVRQMFEEEGYRIKPTGYSGGIWQTTEHICW